MSSFIGDRMTTIAQTIERRLDPENASRVLGEGLEAWSKKVSPGGEKVAMGALVHLALLNDALVIAEKAVMHDGVFTPEERAFVTPLAQTAVRYLVHFRRAYEEFEADLGEVKDFLDAHMNDSQPFGGRCNDTRWTGAQICRSFAVHANDDGPLLDYRETMVRLVDDIFELTEGGEPDAQSRLRAEIERHSHLERDDSIDGRAAAFCAPEAGVVFHAVAHAEEVFERDAADVEAIHAEARDAFARTLQRVVAVNHRSRYGAMLLVKGESGAGKTHLMRAFRDCVHEARLGYVGYLQMTSAGGSYVRHVLSSVIDSLERPFLAGEPSSLACLADALMQRRVAPELAASLREEADPDARATIVGRIVDHLVAQEALATVDVDLLRAFVYLASNDAVIGARVKRYLRCEPLNEYDRRHLGGITPPSDDNAPLRLLVGVGKLIAASHGGALVLLVDQLEDIYDGELAQQRFRQLMDALRQVTELVPTSLAVVASLDDFYEKLRGGLARPVLDRLEQDPKPVHIVASRTRAEVELLLSARLKLLFERQGGRAREDEPLWPFEPEHVNALTGLRTRDILEWCRAAQERCAEGGRIVPFLAPGGSVHPPPRPPAKPLASAWAQHLSAFQRPGTTDEALVQLLAWGLEQAGREIGVRVAASAKDGLTATVGDGDGARRSAVGICNAAPQGGALTKQVDAIVRRAKASDARVVLVRCQDFPPAGRSAVAQKIGAVIKEGGAKIVACEREWHALAALRAFVEAHADSAELEAWLREVRVAARLELVETIVGRLREAPRADTRPPVPVERQPPSVAPPPPPSSPAPPERARAGAGVLGRTRSLSPSDVTRDPGELTRHAAFLGSSGSGKTTFALNVVEQCLAQGVPALLVDRKGDLCRYGSAGFWDEVEPDPARAARKRALRERVHVQVFTPGEHRGRPLALAVIPPGLAESDVSERTAMAASAAAGLGSMMGYKTSQQDRARLAILEKGIAILGQLGGRAELGLKELIALVSDEDPALVDAIGKLNPRHFAHLVDHLETLRIRFESILRGGEPLNADRLFGTGPFAVPGKTTLSVISTKFLPDAGAVDFWVSRLLLELTRWSSRNPSSRLQAIVMLDEADIYLPAQTKPATKQPMQDLLRRARSAGVGVFLATQSPGDLDYRCRDNITSWFVGRISEKTALDKMRPLLSDYRSNFAGKLATAHAGEFFALSEGRVAEIKAERSLMNTSQLGEDEIVAVSRAGADAL